MTSKISQKGQYILKVLRASGKPLSSSAIVEELKNLGVEMSERTVRAYLSEMDRIGLTYNHGKRGREITALGLKELDSARAYEKVGFLSSKIENLTYLMDFDLNHRTGTVVINVSFVDPVSLYENLEAVHGVFEKGYAMGQLLTLFEPKEKVGFNEVPEAMVGIGTVCSITINGVLLKYGIPTQSKFGGLLEIEDGKPIRFVEIIYYDATTIDPLEVFIRSGMTDYTGAINNGTGKIGVGFREFPAESRAMVVELAKRLEKIGLGGFLRIGMPGRPLLDIPVGEGRVGAVVIGGLNPIAILEERGHRTHSKAMAGLVDFQRLFHHKELDEALKPHLP